MRLLNTDTLELHEFTDGLEPPYAILSHTWGSQEVSYVDYTEGRGLDGYGYQKIRNLCSTVKTYHIEWAWIHSCCVDRTSSAELSEAMNSSYEWFQRSEVCFVHLADIQISSPGDIVLGKQAGRKDFVDSRWFTRSWTLHELLAPREVIFLDRDCTPIGYKGSHSARVASLENLNDKITAITGIETRYLLQFTPTDASVSERLEWARNRKYAHVEDVAYSLVGLFQVQMPIRYGEGTVAFTRLKREIERGHRSVGASFITRGFSRTSALSIKDTEGNPMYMNAAGRRRERHTVQEKVEIPYELTEDGLKLVNNAEKPQVLHIPHQAVNNQTQNHSDLNETRSTSSTLYSRNNTVDQLRPPAPNKFAWPICWTIITCGIVVIGGSLGVGIFFSTKGQMGDGFTLAGWIIAVGTLGLAIPITQHYPRCTCWKKASDTTGQFELHPMYS